MLKYSLYTFIYLVCIFDSAYSQESQSSEIEGTALIDFTEDGLQNGYNLDRSRIRINGAIFYENYSIEGTYESTIGNERLSTVEVSAFYTYATEFIYISGGINIKDYGLIDPSPISAVIELEGRQEILGFIPELHVSKSINKPSIDYINFRLGKEVYRDRFLINPYAEFAIGSIYSDGFKSNNVLFGVDVVTPIGDEIYISPHVAINIPLDSVKEFDEEANTSIEIGLALRKDF